jgi:predicted ester cyclase
MKGKVTLNKRVFVLFTCFLTSIVNTGCKTSKSENVLERNKNLVRQMNDVVWNKSDLDRMDEFFSPHFVRHFLPGDSELKGIDSLREHERMLREAFPDWREEIKHIVAEGDLVVIHFVSTGTNLGSWIDKPPTGRKIIINEMSILRIEDDKVAEQWLLPDIYSMEQQLAQTEN